MNERIYDLYLGLLTNYYSQLAKECNSNVHFVALEMLLWNRDFLEMSKMYSICLFIESPDSAEAFPCSKIDTAIDR